MLKRRGFDNIALTLFDNETHKLLSNFFDKENLNVHNINYRDKTRINIKYYGKQNNFELNILELIWIITSFKKLSIK
ncbi:hypothetical protein NWQ34_05365 [Mycoplasmopsis felis]|uniref:hypothetical protein n=1 Tax=Mycoplasmopsis felis TaxID=33923 RepID=UPI0021E0DBCF|nr:hypothetical protein [Mycoplasmopsis felis]MCU9938997.1 hypothetical protein [Mycoplasmopsis felis]